MLQKMVTACAPFSDLFMPVELVVRCSFLIGSLRSSPVRPISTPRLELQAVTLSVKMYRVLVDELT